MTSKWMTQKMTLEERGRGGRTQKVLAAGVGGMELPFIVI